MAKLPGALVFKKPMDPITPFEMSSDRFLQMQNSNEVIPFMSPDGTRVTFMRVRDGKVQHIQKNGAVKITLPDGLNVRVRGTSVEFDKLPGTTVEAFCQVSPYKFESLQKPTIVPEICVNFHCSAITSNKISLGLGDFMVVFQRGRVPDIIIFITDASMQAAWPTGTMSEVYRDLVGTFKYEGGELQVDMEAYVKYMVRHIEPAFMSWEFFPDELEPKLSV
jgi:hypothetical protein